MSAVRPPSTPHRGIDRQKRLDGASGQVLWLDGAGDALQFTAGAPFRLLLFAGPPLREPVVAHGPFVMNTEAEIAAAFADYRAGRF